VGRANGGTAEVAISDLKARRLEEANEAPVDLGAGLGPPGPFRILVEGPVATPLVLL
jgi:hypothetical protein